MKQCPVCHRNYADDRLAYCLEDGVALIAAANVPNPNLPPTQPSPRVKYTPAPTERIAPGQFASFPVVEQSPQNSKSKGWLVLAALLFLIVAAIVIFGFLFLRGNSNAVVGDSFANVNGNSPSDKNSIANASPTALPTALPALRTAENLVGAWKTNVVEDKTPQEITVTLNANGNSLYIFKDKRGKTADDRGTWQYSDGVLYEQYANGASGKSAIKWIDDDNIDLTIIDNGVPAFKGVVRHYRRVK